MVEEDKDKEFDIPNFGITTLREIEKAKESNSLLYPLRESPKVMIPRESKKLNKRKERRKLRKDLNKAELNPEYIATPEEKSAAIKYLKDISFNLESIDINRVVCWLNRSQIAQKLMNATKETKQESSNE